MDTLEKYAPKKHNRKKENIELLEYLLKEFQTNPYLEDVRLGQLLFEEKAKEAASVLLNNLKTAPYSYITSYRHNIQ